MCNAYAEIGLLVLVYIVLSSCRVSVDLPVWPTYELLQVLHFNLYMPLEFILFSGTAYALHILNNKHENGNADQTIQLLKPCNKGNKKNGWEPFYIQIF